MIIEHELLEQIADDERDFAFALRIYDGDLKRLKRALLHQVGDDLIEVWRADEVRFLTVSELKAICSDEVNFLDARHAANFSIQLTDKGQQSVFS